MARPDPDPVLPSQAMVKSSAYSTVDGDITSLDVPDFANMPFDEFCRKFLNNYVNEYCSRNHREYAALVSIRN